MLSADAGLVLKFADFSSIARIVEFPQANITFFKANQNLVLYNNVAGDVINNALYA